VLSKVDCDIVIDLTTEGNQCRWYQLRQSDFRQFHSVGE
jgi:hypothetical protein